mmetsp:Transcript_21204/g.56568  ORF Transcript_21204/g.56568 Transcript_21204/m.56568 type:complete len:215 (+) Transcript_21204:1780-2424(+)
MRWAALLHRRERPLRHPLHRLAGTPLSGLSSGDSTVAISTRHPFHLPLPQPCSLHRRAAPQLRQLAAGLLRPTRRLQRRLLPRRTARHTQLFHPRPQKRRCRLAQRRVLHLHGRRRVQLLSPRQHSQPRLQRRPGPPPRTKSWLPKLRRQSRTAQQPRDSQPPRRRLLRAMSSDLEQRHRRSQQRQSQKDRSLFPPRAPLSRRDQTWCRCGRMT